ncbi:hypothetical protein FNJ84_03250 [Paracoccus sp. M683]|uniref:hypothetical protein n=1 Tax=Paracoccus sp. M683 TaxID=2594268 RepID=UPI00117D90FF|nr:hypothetical protein [Paracoccus sp. M683]TRW98591.1 hypothetical protein FNJ84_03250 [Paracoccus sp. M683]
MAYGFQTGAFYDLAGRMRDYPDGVANDDERLAELSRSYIEAATALFALMLLILQARIRRSATGGRYDGFVLIYQDRVNALLAELREFLLEGPERADTAEIRDFLEGVRRGALAEEMEALQYAVDQSTGNGTDADADEEATTTVTNSLKEQIERRIKRKWIKDILHAINEALSVMRGVS